MKNKYCVPMQCTLPTKPMVKVLSADEIIERSCYFVNISKDQLVGRSRKREIKDSRHMVAFLITEHTILTLKQIGEILGGRDHTTIINSKKVTNNLCDSDPNFRNNFNLLRNYVFCK